MLTPSKGFCYCLPVRLGALVVSFFTFSGSLILAVVTLHTLSTLSAHVTSGQTAAFYLAFLSWLFLAVVLLIGFVASLMEHPLILTVASRSMLYHLPVGLFCNILFLAISFHSYRDDFKFLQSEQCTGLSPDGICSALITSEKLTWVYLILLLPTCLLQIYAHVIFKRTLFVISGDWAMQHEETLQRTTSSPITPKRSTTIPRTVGRGGRRRAKALWFTMETPGPELESDDSFLPSMIISPMDFKSPTSPYNRTSPSAFIRSLSPKLHKMPSKLTLTSEPDVAVPDPVRDVPLAILGRGDGRLTDRSPLADTNSLDHNSSSPTFRLQAGGMTPVSQS